MKLKNITALLAALLFAFAVVACDNDDDPTAAPATEAPVATEAAATDAPVETEAPVEETEAPAEETEAPVEETVAPVESPAA